VVYIISYHDPGVASNSSSSSSSGEESEDEVGVCIEYNGHLYSLEDVALSLWLRRVLAGLECYY